jgi:hypothetical protein
MDDGRINVSTNHGENYTCAERERERERECAVALPVFLVRLCCVTSTHRASLPFPV